MSTNGIEEIDRTAVTGGEIVKEMDMGLNCQAHGL